MSAEKLKTQPNAELIESPIILVNKLNSFLTESGSDPRGEQLRKWISEGWEAINGELMQISDVSYYDGDGNRMLERLPIRDGATRYLKEFCPRLKVFNNIDKLWVEMHFQSAINEENPYIVDMLFAADRDNRNQLLGARLEYKTLKRPEKPATEQIFEMGFSSDFPSLLVEKIK